MQAFGFGNTVFPVALLLCLAVGLPVLTVPPRVMTQGALGRGMALAVALVLVAGAVIFADLYRRAGNDVLAALRDDPFGRAWFFASHAALSGMFWGPVMVFVWYGRAIEVERRKGEARAKRGDGR